MVDNISKKRWYDIDPTVSAAVSQWESAEEHLQTICAEYVIDKLKDIDFNMSLDEQYDYILRRWYDKNVKVSHAMEYLRLAPEDLRKELALDIIEYLNQNADEN